MASPHEPNPSPFPNPDLLAGYLQQAHVRLQEVLQGPRISLKKLFTSYRSFNYDLEKADPMRRFFKAQKKLWQEGKPVWGFIVSVQELLWQSDKDCGLGLLLHPLDPEDLIHPDALTYAAQFLWQAMEQPDEFPECKDLIGKIQGGNQRLFGHQLPELLSPSCPLALTHICVDKNKLLQQPFDHHPFPALFLPESAIAVLMPSWTWPKDMFQIWQDQT